MSLMRWDVLNSIANRIRAERYLEIGVGNGTCLRQITVARKVGVDPNPQPEGVRAATRFADCSSDAFFDPALQGDEQFDLVFIDGLHTAAQAYRDVQNALRVLSPIGIICLHDCNPSSEMMQLVPAVQEEWTGDVWKAIARLRRDGEHTVRVVDTDYGIGIVIPHARETPIELDVEAEDLQWPDLVARRLELVGLLSATTWFEHFDRLVSSPWNPPRALSD